MQLIDIGCNLASPRLLKNLEQILASAEAAGVTAQILTGTDSESNQTSLSLAESHANLYAAIGFHPHHAASWQPKHHAPQHLAALKHPKACAAGEMGLDYFRNLAPKTAQIRCFADQLDIAVQAQKPVFLHERQAFDDFRQLLAPTLPALTGAVWHCFAADANALDWALSQGLYIGITGWIADPQRGRTLRDIVRHIPDDKIMIETDAPYLTPKTLNPMPKINEPQYLPEVLRVLSECRQQDPETLAGLTYANTCRFFSISPA